jgi:hypothetical protein
MWRGGDHRLSFLHFAAQAARSLEIIRPTNSSEAPRHKISTESIVFRIDGESKTEMPGESRETDYAKTREYTPILAKLG